MLEDVNLMRPWTAVPATGITFNENDGNILWHWDAETPNASTGEVEIYTYTSFVLLVRMKATANTVHSELVILEYLLPSEPSE